jgi:hypothetical protein
MSTKGPFYTTLTLERDDRDVDIEVTYYVHDGDEVELWEVVDVDNSTVDLETTHKEDRQIIEKCWEDMWGE